MDDGKKDNDDVVFHRHALYRFACLIQILIPNHIVKCPVSVHTVEHEVVNSILFNKLLGIA